MYLSTSTVLDPNPGAMRHLDGVTRNIRHGRVLEVQVPRKGT